MPLFAPASTTGSSAVTAPGLILPGARPGPNSKIITTFQSGHGYANNAGGSANLNDTSQYVLGTQSVSATTSGTGTAKTIKRTGFTAINATGLVPRVWLKVDDDTNLSQLQLYLGDTALANCYVWPMQATSSPRWLTAGDWHMLTLSWGEAQITGTPTRSAITDAQFRVQDNAAGAVTVHMSGIALVPESTTWPNGVCSLTFDDTYASHYTQARAKMDQYGYGGTAYVIQDVIGTNNCMTLAQMKDLEQYSSWEIAGHATTGAIHNNRFTALTDAQLDTEFAAIRSFLSTNGFRGDHIAYPGGQFNNSVLTYANKYFTGARLVFQKPETLPPARRSKIRSVTQASNVITTATIQAQVDQAYTNKEWIIMTFHDIVTTVSASTDFSIANFGTIIDYLATKGIPVRTVGEVLATRPT
jgi:peptidoglycan/xylan/chitin deacetylase (PgdA/CDA1 family)